MKPWYNQRWFKILVVLVVLCIVIAMSATIVSAAPWTVLAVGAFVVIRLVAMLLPDSWVRGIGVATIIVTMLVLIVSIAVGVMASPPQGVIKPAWAIPTVLGLTVITAVFREIGGRTGMSVAVVLTAVTVWAAIPANGISVYQTVVGGWINPVTARVYVPPIPVPDGKLPGEEAVAVQTPEKPVETPPPGNKQQADNQKPPEKSEGEKPAPPDSPKPTTMEDPAVVHAVQELLGNIPKGKNGKTEQEALGTWESAQLGCGAVNNRDKIQEVSDDSVYNYAYRLWCRGELNPGYRHTPQTLEHYLRLRAAVTASIPVGAGFAAPYITVPDSERAGKAKAFLKEKGIDLGTDQWKAFKAYYLDGMRNTKS